jgi:hypothetical protein
MKQQAVESALRRRFGPSLESAERLRDFNATQTYRGQCRGCGARWFGLLKEALRPCPHCGLGERDGE